MNVDQLHNSLILIQNIKSVLKQQGYDIDLYTAESWEGHKSWGEIADDIIYWAESLKRLHEEAAECI